MDIILSSISGPPYVVTSDQVLSGTVRFVNEKKSPSGFITISLIGRAETTFNKGRTVYQSTATLFNNQQTLHDGPLNTENEWKFEFTFPKVTTGEKKKWLDVPPYQVNDGHKLPPSTIFDSGNIERDSGKGFIVYFLEARFSKFESKSTSIFASSEPDARVLLYHIPYRQTEVPGAQIAGMGKESYTVSSKLLDPNSVSGEKKSFFKKFKTPTSIFEVAVTAPRVVYVGGPLPVTLTLKHDLQGSTAPKPPVVKLKSCSLLIVRTMHSVGKAVMEEDGQYSTMELIAGKNDLDIPLSETNSLSDILDLSAFRTTYGMTFATYNIAQSFRFLLKATFECAEKQLWTELKSSEIYVLPPFTKERLDREGGDLVHLLQGLNVRSEGGGDVDAAGTGMLESVLGLAAAAVFSF